MKKALLVLVFLDLYIGASAQFTTRLHIAPRLQWPNNDGYCGENSIQMCGLYYGNYISEGLCRRVAGGELLIYVNDTIALNTLSFTYSEWDPNGATPQYKNYLDWVKQFLNKKQPVIFVVYINGLSDPDYDHIIPATGFYATNVNTYTGTDSLIYNSNFDTTSFVRAFSTIYDTRSMKGNGAIYSYCIPQNVDYGVAVTGNKDPGHVTRPVHITLDSNEEPNVSLGVPPCILRATITVDSLTIGKSYALLRYNNYLTVPSTGFKPSNANATVYFTATSVTKTVIDSFMSDTAVFYRCIPYTPTGINEVCVANDNPLVYPNPSTGRFNVLLPANTEQIEVLNVMGQVIQRTNVHGMNDINMYVVDNGIYFIRIKGGNISSVCRLVVI